MERLNGLPCDELETMLLEGLTVKELALQIGVTPKRLRNFMISNGIQFEAYKAYKDNGSLIKALQESVKECRRHRNRMSDLEKRFESDMGVIKDQQNIIRRYEEAPEKLRRVEIMLREKDRECEELQRYIIGLGIALPQIEKEYEEA